MGRILKVITISLLFALPLALRGQAKLPIYKGSDWQTLLVKGGVFRSGDYFLRIDEGVGSLMSVDFVNGFAVGSKTTIGKVLSDYSRIEIDENVKWACSREQLMARGALRYVFAPQYFGFFEVFGGRLTNDFDRYPVMGDSERSMATALFGWNHFKLYEQTTVGARLYGALSADVQLTALAAWEKRSQVVNHRKTSIFGKDAAPNIPEIGGVPMADFGTDKILRLDWQIDYIPGRMIMVENDMNAIAQSKHPTYSIRGTTGIGGKLRYISLEAMISGMRDGWGKNQKVVYQASAGFFPVRNSVLLMDMRHFDASAFALQTKPNIALFSLLDNYELSTSKPWVEAHAEWTNLFWYAQAHAVKVVGRQMHSELSGGISLSNLMRIGVSVGFDDFCYDAVGVNVVVKM